MNTDNPVPDQLEQQLADFDRTSLPEDWKDELIDNAVSAAPSNVRKITFSLFQKVSLSGIAAAWVAIAILHLTTPSTDLNRTAEAAESQQDSSVPQLPLFVHYIEQRNAVTQQY